MYQGHMAFNSVSDFLDVRIGGDWRHRYRYQMTHTRYLDSLRECLGEALRCFVWLELGIGRSMRCAVR